MKQLSIIDFDRTLFDTGRFHEDLLAALATSHGLDVKKFLAEILPKTQHLVYDIFEHLQQYNIDEAAVKETATSRLAGQNYLFADAGDAIKRLSSQGEVAVVTVGHPDYQEFKRSLCPEIMELPFVVVPYNKGRWLAEHANNGLSLNNGAYDHLRLIDDNPTTFEVTTPQANIEYIQIVRPGAPYPATALDHVKIISSLLEL